MLKFTIKQEPTHCYSGYHCNIGVQLDIKQVRENRDVNCNIPISNHGSRAVPENIYVLDLSNNPGGCLFETMKCLFRNNEITILQNAGNVNTIYRMLYERKGEQKRVYSTNASNPLSMEDSAVITGVMHDDYVALAEKLEATSAAYISEKISKHMIWAMKNNQFDYD